MRPVTARIVAATHLALGPALDAGRFREDLYHRLRAYTVEVPPLRARRDDLPGLVQHMLSGTGLVPNVNAWEALLVYAWPGNVRELEQVLREAIPHCRQPVLDLDDLRAELMTPFAGRRPVTTGMPPEAALLDIARDRRPTADEVRRVMAHHNGNIAAVAEFFGKDRKQVHRWLTDYAIDREDYR
jgi:DNA-binding NtrC family response regulator